MNDSFKFSILIGVGVLTFLAFLVLSLRDDNIAEFIAVAELYQETYDSLEPAIFAPGSGASRARQGVSEMLSRVLMGDVDNSERTDIATQGIAYTDKLDTQVEKIDAVATSLRPASAELVSAANQVRGRSARVHATAVADIVEQRLVYIDEVQELLSAMNGDTRDIFERVITNGGKVTDAHISNLNANVEGAEIQYDRLAYVYTELEALNKQFENHFFELRVLLNR